MSLLFISFVPLPLFVYRLSLLSLRPPRRAVPWQRSVKFLHFHNLQVFMSSSEYPRRFEFPWLVPRGSSGLMRLRQRRHRDGRAEIYVYNPFLNSLYIEALYKAAGT